MNIPLGYFITILCALGGYALHGGDIKALWQPTELIIIGGAAIGTMVASNAPALLKKVVSVLPLCFKPASANKRRALDLLCLMYELLNKIRKDGLMSIESDIEEPMSSKIFEKYPSIKNDHHLVDFITDYLRMMLGGSLNVIQLETLLERELEIHHHEEFAPISVLQKTADALPAFGIVAAVMGVVQTMASIGLPPAELGKLIAAALVGTFLGILMSYCFVGPIASVLEQRLEQESKMFETVKVVLLAHLNNFPPPVSVEFGRKILFSTQRPSFKELDQETKSVKGR
jgi:chemotaxis protein MotA